MNEVNENTKTQKELRDSGLTDLNANEKKRVLKRNFMAARLEADPTRVFRSFGPAT